MTDHLSRFSSGCRSAAILALALWAIACGGGKKNVIPPNTQPDRYLMDRANEAMMKKQWMRAREYFRQVVDNYPGSPLRPDAKLGIGDTYLNEGGTENYVLGENEFREFLTFYPTNARADYAQYHLALCHYKQMRAPARDQTETKDAVKEFEVFIDRYATTSSLTNEVREKYRQARDRLSEASFLVGKHYYTVKWYVGAVSRFREVLMDDPGFTQRDDVYFYLAESIVKGTPNKKLAADEAIPYYNRLLTEFPMSDHADEARKRLAELQAEPSQAKAQ